jgi:hypothetical protein
MKIALLVGIVLNVVGAVRLAASAVVSGRAATDLPEDYLQ